MITIHPTHDVRLCWADGGHWARVAREFDVAAGDEIQILQHPLEMSFWVRVDRARDTTLPWSVRQTWSIDASGHSPALGPLTIEGARTGARR